MRANILGRSKETGLWTNLRSLERVFVKPKFWSLSPGHYLITEEEFLKQIKDTAEMYWPDIIYQDVIIEDPYSKRILWQNGQWINSYPSYCDG